MARPKSKRNIQALNLSIDKDILEEARLTIDNMSLFVEACLKRHIESEKKRKDSQLRIMDIQSTKNDNHDYTYEELCDMMKEISDEEFEKIMEDF